MKTKRTEFIVNLTTQFGVGLDRRKCALGETPERTFMNAWKSLPKRIDKTWFSIEFDQNEKHFHLTRETFREFRFDFDLAVEITKL